jgi:hypothetical protein
MNTTKYYNETDKEWQDIEVDEIGLPLTPERLEEMELIKVQQEVIENEMQSFNIPERPFDQPYANFYNAISGVWETLFPSPSQNQEWDSWTQREDGLWYAPVNYPSEIPGEYIWDELELGWLQIQGDMT